jgi:hypothetical protein
MFFARCVDFSPAPSDGGFRGSLSRLPFDGSAAQTVNCRLRTSGHPSDALRDFDHPLF